MSLVLDSSITQIFTKSGTEITKVVRKSDGAVLWEKITAYYAYQNGVANTAKGITNPTLTYSVVKGGSFVTQPYIEVYKDGICTRAQVKANKGSDGQEWHMTTPNLPTNGQTTVKIDLVQGDDNTSGTGGCTNYVIVYGVSSGGTETELYNNPFNGVNYPMEVTLDVSSYANIKVVIKVITGATAGVALNRTPYQGIKNVYFYS